MKQRLAAIIFSFAAYGWEEKQDLFSATATATKKSRVSQKTYILSKKDVCDGVGVRGCGKMD